MAEQLPASKEGIRIANEVLAELEKGGTNVKLAVQKVADQGTGKYWYGMKTPRQKDEKSHTINNQSKAPDHDRHWTIDKNVHKEKDSAHHTVVPTGGRGGSDEGHRYPKAG